MRNLPSERSINSSRQRVMKQYAAGGAAEHMTAQTISVLPEAKCVTSVKNEVMYASVRMSQKSKKEASPSSAHHAKSF